MKERKYIVVSRKIFDTYSSAACPLNGQIATNNKIFAYLLYEYLRYYSHKHFGSIAVMLVKRNNEGTYDAIKR